MDLGTIAAYDISPVMMDIYGLEEPLYFQFLNRQLRVASRTNTRGTTMNLDGTTTQEPTEFQQRWCAEHWLLQYDLMFGKGYALQRMGLAGLQRRGHRANERKTDVFLCKKQRKTLATGVLFVIL